MIKKKFTLQEAFQKGLLLDGEKVHLELLYKPYKVVLEGDESFESYSLRDLYGENAIVGTIYEDDRKILVSLTTKEVSDDSAQRMASKFLSEDMYQIKATYWQGFKQTHFKIVMGPDITVRFQGNDEIPILELPPHNAYTC